jgi:YidC/Oxa1 family membrane protein insertase
MVDIIGRLFSPITGVLGGALRYFHYTLGLEWWLAIVLLTLIVRSLLFPLTIKQVRNMRQVQSLKPELDKLKTKYSGNTRKQREAQTRLYQERGINPLGGCLPLLVQMPIFIGIFYVIRHFGGFQGGFGGASTSASEPSFREGGLLWFTDLSSSDSTLILPILAAATMLASMEVTNKSMEPQQRWLMRLLPVGFTFFTYWFPAGMFVYWITSNLVTLTQNYVIYNFLPGSKRSEAEKPSKTGGPVKGASRASDNGIGMAQNGNPPPGASSATRAKRKRRKKKK